MTARSPETRALYTRLEEVLGEEQAATLMNYLPLETGSDLATKADLAAFEARLDERFTRIDERFTQIDERFTQIDERFEKLDERIYGIHVALGNQYKNYSITMVGGMTALTAIYAGLLAILAFAISV